MRVVTTGFCCCCLMWLIAFILIPISPLIRFILYLLVNSNSRSLKGCFLLVCVTAIIVDPLFFYTPVISDDKKCIQTNQTLGITAAVLRSFLDSYKLTYISVFIRRSPRRSAGLWLTFLGNIVATLPIPQVLVFSHIARGTNFFFAMNFFLLQYLLRVGLVFNAFTKATSVLGILGEAKWAIVAFNLLLYMLGAHVFGALWYFYATVKATACWKKACDINQAGCSHRRSFSCHDSSGDYNFLNDYCGIKTGNTTNYDFGLFDDALQSGIVELTDFPKKLLYCLQWGLQNVSAFGQNLKTSTDILENIFAISMTLFGVVLFVFLIGKMQSDTERSQKIKLNLREIREWPYFKNLSKEYQELIRKYRRFKWKETQRVGVDNLLNDLPDDLASDVKREIGFKLLRKVEEFENLRYETLSYLCDHLKPVYVIERTRILREGDPIDEMVFVLEGKLRAYTSTNVTANTSLGFDFCGQELIAWAQNESSSNLPRSTRTIQALTNVEAFYLMAEDLKHALGHHDRAALPST